MMDSQKIAGETSEALQKATAAMEKNNSGLDGSASFSTSTPKHAKLLVAPHSTTSTATQSLNAEELKKNINVAEANSASLPTLQKILVAIYSIFGKYLF
jgi:hypothetical protein